VAVAVIALLAAGVVGGVIANAINGSSGGTSGGSSAGHTAITSSASSCDVSQVADERLPSIVTIVVGTAGGGAGGVGSGEVIRANGYVLTNDHVIAPAGSGGQIQVRFNSGSISSARVVGRDPRSDLAVLHVADAGTLQAIPIGDSAGLRVGQPVVALGAPLGLSSSVTSGIVSALGRTVRLPGAEGVTALLVDAVQTDAAINPGNSGGALVDCSGAMIGVPTAGASAASPNGQASVGSIGLGFAIPANFAKRVADELIETGSVSHAYLGMSAVQLAEAPGLLVTAVVSGGPAAQAGLREGDVIVSIEGEPAASVDQLGVLTLSKRAGERVELSYKRDGRQSNTTLTLGSRE
jgi:putative serine protease PepD